MPLILRFFGAILLCAGLLHAACEVPPFDPSGYRCDATIHCLPEYVCDVAKKICVYQEKEPARSDGGEARVPEGGRGDGGEARAPETREAGASEGRKGA